MYIRDWSPITGPGSGPVSAGRPQRQGAGFNVTSGGGRGVRLAGVGGRLTGSRHVVVEVAVRGGQGRPVAVYQVGRNGGLEKTFQ